MSNCIFCQIAAGKIPAQKVYEDEHCLAFKDIHPKAPVHVLLIPKKHIDSLAHAEAEDQVLLGHLSLTLGKIAKQLGVSHGFRTQIHTGKAGGQEVFHLHYHILAEAGK